MPRDFKLGHYQIFTVLVILAGIVYVIAGAIGRK